MSTAAARPQQQQSPKGTEGANSANEPSLVSHGIRFWVEARRRCTERGPFEALLVAIIYGVAGRAWGMLSDRIKACHCRT
jgi:hypothetical protein